MAKKKSAPPPDEDEVPTGQVDEDGDEILDLFDERDDLTDDVIYDLSEIDDEMLADETEDEEFGMEVDEVVQMLRLVKCNPCPGSDSKPECQVRHDYGCPPGKEGKKRFVTE